MIIHHTIDFDSIHLFFFCSFLFFFNLVVVPFGIKIAEKQYNNSRVIGSGRGDSLLGLTVTPTPF